MRPSRTGRGLQLALVVLQAALLLPVVGDVDALTLPGEWLAVALPTVGSLAAAVWRQPTTLVPVGVVVLLAASAAGLGVVPVVLLGSGLLGQVVLAEDPAVVATGPLVALLLLAAAIAGGAALALADLPRPPAWVAVSSLAAVAVPLVVGAARSDGGD